MLIGQLRVRLLKSLSRSPRNRTQRRGLKPSKPSLQLCLEVWGLDKPRWIKRIERESPDGDVSERMVVDLSLGGTRGFQLPGARVSEASPVE